MTPAQAAKIIGCTSHHVRLLIRNRKLRAKKKRITSSIQGKQSYEYDITAAEAQRYRAVNTGRGRKRGPIR